MSHYKLAGANGSDLVLHVVVGVRRPIAARSYDELVQAVIPGGVGAYQHGLKHTVGLNVSGQFIQVGKLAAWVGLRFHDSVQRDFLDQGAFSVTGVLMVVLFMGNSPFLGI